MAASIFNNRPRLVRRWPLPALLAWVLGYALVHALLAAGARAAVAWAVGSVAVLALAWVQRDGARRACVLAGWAALAWLLQPGGMPAWVWLAAAAVLALLYPLRAWRDAPLFPTPRGALAGLGRRIALPGQARVLDAGCGLGHGLRELHAAFPQARLHGTEWSWPLALLARIGCRFAQVRRGDLWSEDWSGFDLVYLFQRPESMRRAYAKAQREMRPGRWLVSLEFAVPGVRPHATLPVAGGRRLCLYRMPADAGVKPELPG